MDAAVIDLAMGLGLHTAIGYFAPVLFGIVNLIQTLLALFLYADKSTEFNKAAIDHGLHEDYDFIIVGGGTSGSILARRLSSKQFNVLLLERGGEPNPLTLVPGLQQGVLDNREADYLYTTVAQNSSCFSCLGRQTFQNAGFGLGGNSMINGLIYIRGHPYDYDRWAKVTDDPRWNYNNLLPYFLRGEGYCHNCENTPGVKPQINPKYHNHDGEMPMRPLPYTPLVPQFLSAMEWSGVPKADMNAPYYDEVADVHVNNARGGRRVSSYHAFIEPILGKTPFLKVVKYARVIEILFKPGTKQAVGVKYERFGKLETAMASKEIIVSAGAIESPKLLLLSGIGPTHDLQALNIPVRCNLPVGRNFQNHLTTFIGPFLINKPLSMIVDRDFNQETAEEYLKNGTGPFSVIFARAHTMLTSSVAIKDGEEHWPDIQIHLQSNGVAQRMDVELVRHYNLRLDLLSEFLGPIKGRDAFVLNVNAGRPKSRGVISLRSTNYLDEPLIDPNFFSDPNQDDLRVTVDGIQRIVHIAENAPSFKRIGATLSPIPYPACVHLPFRTDKYWECYVTHVSLSMHHFTGTVAMGKANSSGAVVDSELRVIGAKGLRVIDASIQPHVVSTNTYAATMAIAERGADFILEEYLH